MQSPSLTQDSTLLRQGFNIRQEVFLPLVPQSEFNKHNSDGLEPQMVRLRQPNVSSLYINPSNNESEINKCDMQVSSQRLNSQGFPNPLISNVKRIAVRQFGCLWSAGNITRFNQIIQFTLTSTGPTIHSITLPLTLYTTGRLLLAAIITKMNDLAIPDHNFTISTVVGTGGINGLSIIDTLDEEPGLIFLPSCPFMLYSSSIAGSITSFTEGIEFDDFGMIYTKYIDIFSSALTKNTRNRNRANVSNDGNLLFRYYLLEGPETIYSEFQNTTATNYYAIPYGWNSTYLQNMDNLNWINVNESEQISIIDIQIRDQYGNVLSNQELREWYMDLAMEL
jgi:hypothetical protein